MGFKILVCEVCAHPLNDKEGERLEDLREDNESLTAVYDGLCFSCGKARRWAEAAKTNVCAGCCEDADCPCVKQCEDEYCERHFSVEETIQAARLGISTSMTKEQRQAQLRAMAPIGICGTCCLVEEDCMCEPMPLDWHDRWNEDDWRNER